MSHSEDKMCCDNFVLLKPCRRVRGGSKGLISLAAIDMAGSATLGVLRHIWAGGVSYSFHMGQFCCSMELERTDIRVCVTETASPIKHISSNVIKPTCFRSMMIDIKELTEMWNTLDCFTDPENTKLRPRTP